MKKVRMDFGNRATVFKFLGKLYRNPADAIKEHVSNAIDEHLKAREIGNAQPVCRVTFTFRKDKVIIDYPYGMSKEEFQKALQRVADSAKKQSDFAQIGQLGIGMFSFFQIGRKCTFISRKNRETETVRVTIREGSDCAEFDTPRKRELLSESGIKIIISGLLFDPTKSRGPLSPARLKKVFAERFNPYIRDGLLEIVIHSEKKSYKVKPLEIDLPQICKGYEIRHVKGDPNKIISLELYFDRSGKGNVGIRHTGVTIVDDIKTLSAYGLEESIFASGYVKGFIDADFLKPLPARTGFEENNDWIKLLDELYKICPSIEAEVENLKEEEAEKKLTEIQKKAIELARDILNTDEFQDLELLGGLGRKPREPIHPPNGFDFVPSSIRTQLGKTGTLSLKAFVPKKVPSNSLVELSISDSSSVELITKSLFLKASEADKDGVVIAHVYLKAISKNIVPVIITAATGELKAKASIRIAEPEGTREPIIGKQKEGRGINYVEVPFEEGPSKHSRYVSRIIQINMLNPDYKQLKRPDEKIAYGALMIGKETIAYNEKGGVADEYLEKMLSFYFRLKNRLTGSSPNVVKRPRGRPRKSI